MAKPKPTLIIDGQSLAEPLPTGLDLANFVSALAASQKYDLELIVGQDFPRTKPALAQDYPDINWHRLDFGPQANQAWSPAGRDSRQQVLNHWLAEQKFINQPFVIPDPVSRNYYPAWPAHSRKVCLWPNLSPTSLSESRHLDLIAGSDLICTPTEAIATELEATGLIEAETILVYGHGGLGLEPVTPEAPNPGPRGDFVLWPTASDESDVNQLIAVAWRLFKKQTGRELDLVIIGNLGPTQKAEIRAQVGRRVFFGQHLTANRLAWLYQNAAAVLFVRSQPGRLTPFLAGLEAKRPIIAGPSLDLKQIAPTGPHYCDPNSILTIARAIETALNPTPIEDPVGSTEITGNFNWPQVTTKFSQGLGRLKPGAIGPRPTMALLGPSQLTPGVSGQTIGRRPASWSQGLAIDYFYEGRPPSLTDNNWLLASEQIRYRPLAELSTDELERYQTRVYYLANHPGYTQTMMRALTQPGIIVAPSLRFDRVWRQLIAGGFVSSRRWQLETELEAEAGVDDDCRGAWSLLDRATGLVLESEADCQAAKKIKRPVRLVRLAQDQTDLRAAIEALATKDSPQPISYIDISGLASNWLQNPLLTGIQRYEHQLLTQVRQRRPEVQFVFWQTGAQVLTVIPTLVVDQLIALIADYQTGQQRDNFNRRQRQLGQDLMAANHYLVANEGDRLLIPQGWWDDHNYAKTVTRLCQQINLYHSIHDLVPILYPEHVPDGLKQKFVSYMEQVIPARPHFIAISKHTRQDMLDYQDRIGLSPRSDSSVCYLGDNPANQQPTQEVAALVGQTFILTVGTIEPRKNHQLILDAYQLAEARGQQLPLICIAGRIGWNVNELVAKLKSQILVLLLNNVNDRQLAWLHQNCQLTVFPSLYEGWGLPVAESLAWGCPTLSSNAASLPEVGGDLADYFDPDDAQGLLDLMLKYLDPKANQARRAEIKQKYQPRTWADSIDGLLKIVAGPQPKPGRQAKPTDS